MPRPGASGTATSPCAFGAMWFLHISQAIGCGRTGYSQIS